jgi:IS5 family transposase
MSQSSQELLNAVEEWKVEDEKFTAGNNAAGTRARKALQEVSKLVKARRNRNHRREECS